MTPIALIAVLALSAPEVAPLLALDDYPEATAADDKSAAILAGITVDPTGQIVSCVAESEYGDRMLAKRICPTVMRKHTTAAQFADGRPAYGYIHTLLRVYDASSANSGRVAGLTQQRDFTLKVKALPRGEHEARGRLALAVDAGGAVTDCRSAALPSEMVLPASVCADSAALKQKVRTDGAGQPVPYVTEVTFRLITS
jgi:hypothetical protein